VQIMMVTVQLGFFLGSNALPIRTPRQPRVSLPVLAALIFVFGPIFAAALMAGAPPYVFLILALCLHTYSGCARGGRGVGGGGCAKRDGCTLVRGARVGACARAASAAAATNNHRRRRCRHAPPRRLLRYMTSTVFCVASQGFGSKNVVRVQQLLVLSMGVSYVVGCGISWIWVCIGRA
jgi:hypothetical protein